MKRLQSAHPEVQMNNLSNTGAFRQYLSLPETACARNCFSAHAQVNPLQFLTAACVWSDREQQHEVSRVYY